MKKRVLRPVCIILAFVLAGLALASCGGSNQPASSPAPSDAASAPPAPKQVYNVDINVTLAEAVSPSWAQLFRDLGTRSDGQFDVTVYWSGSLLSIPEIPNGFLSNTVTFGNLPSPNYPDTLPLNCRILQLPYMGLKDPVASSEIWMQLYDEFPQMGEEMAKFNMMAVASTTLGMYDLFFVDKNEVRLPSDLSGRQIVPYKPEMLEMFERFNAAGSYIPPGQIYESLERAVVDGYINNWAFQGWFGLSELIHQSVKLSEYGAFHEFNFLVLNAQFYNSLPADLQKIWIDLFRTEKGYEKMWGDTADLVANEVKKAQEAGNLFVELTPAEQQVWKDELGDVHTVVLAEINATRGDTVATDIYNRAVELIAERNK